jgi:hypothetical protein
MIYDGNDGFTDLPKVVANAVKDLKPYATEFDSIVVTGVSGITVGAPVAIALDKNLVVVRKEDDSSNHSGRRVQGTFPRRWIFLDDFASTGTTKRRVEKEIGYAFPPADFVGRYYYQYQEYRDMRDPVEFFYNEEDDAAADEYARTAPSYPQYVSAWPSGSDDLANKLTQIMKGI